MNEIDDGNGYSRKDGILVQTRRELVWSMDRRGFKPAEIVNELSARPGELLDGISDPYQTVTKDIRTGRAIAIKLREAGDLKEIEGRYIGQLEELYHVAIINKDVRTAREVLHDWARAHGMRVEEAMVVNFNQSNQQTNIIGGNGHGERTIAEVSTNIRGIIAEVERTLSGAENRGRVLEGTQSSDEPS